MKIGLFTATFLDKKIDEVCAMAAGLGYGAIEVPAFSGNPHLDIEEVVKGSNARTFQKMVSSHGLIISALANHPEGQIVLGPYGKDTDGICKGTKEEKIKFGTQRMIKTAQAANALGVPVVTGFVGCENFGRWFPWPYPQGWDRMAEDFVNRWGEILDEFEKQGKARVVYRERRGRFIAYDVRSARQDGARLSDCKL
jgi:sugar phosphate isomerase/epimerase